MSQFTLQDTTEEKGVKILLRTFPENYFLFNDYSTHVKDKDADIDGRIRLRDGVSTYLNLYLHYQLKSHSKIRSVKKYFVNRKILDFLISTNVPTVFFVVNTTTEKVYWLFISESIKKTLRLSKDNKGRSFDLSKNEVAGNFAQINFKWQKFAQKDDFGLISRKLDNVTSKYERDLSDCIGLIYLFGLLKKEKSVLYFSKLLGADNTKVNLYINALVEENIISSTENYYLIDNDKLGIEAIFQLMDSPSFKFDKIDRILDFDEKRRAFRQLVKIEHDKIKIYFKEYIQDFISNYENYDDNDTIIEQLNLIQEFIHITPEPGIELIKKIISSKIIAPVKSTKMLAWEISGKSHDDLLIKAIDMMKHLRYFNIQYSIQQLLNFSINENESIKGIALETIHLLSEYNHRVVREIGYYPQDDIINILVDFSDDDIKVYLEPLLLIIEELLSISFNSLEMTSYNTVMSIRGYIEPNETVIAIRNKAINFLFKLYNLFNDLKTKRIILEKLHEVPQLVETNENIKSMVINDTIKILDFYISYFDLEQNEVIQIIEKQLLYIEKVLPKNNPQLLKVKSLITKNSDYNFFKVLVGYEYHYDKDLTYQEIQDDRKSRIKGIINQIDDNSYNLWMRKLLPIVTNYPENNDPGKYQFLNIFLTELGKEKPTIALKIINEHSILFKPFLVFLISGIWKSSSNNLAIKTINKWIDNNQFLDICASVFFYVDEIDETLIQKIYDRLRFTNYIDALSLLIKSIWYNKINTKKQKTILIASIKLLTKYKSFLWIENLSLHDTKIYDSFKENEYITILNNLIIKPRLGHGLEIFLSTVANKFPLRIIKFFQKRISYEIADEKRYLYSDVPHNFRKLNSTLNKYKSLVFPELLTWFKKKNYLYSFEAGHLISVIFSLKDIDDNLIELIKSKEKNNIEIVLRVFKSYEPHFSLDSKAVQTMIRFMPEYHSRLFLNLSSGGAVQGEYGFVKQLKTKKQVINNWKKDKRKYIRDFVDDYIAFLDDRIKSEQKKADEFIAIRKHDF